MSPAGLNVDISDPTIYPLGSCVMQPPITPIFVVGCMVIFLIYEFVTYQNVSLRRPGKWTLLQTYGVVCPIDTFITSL